MTEDEYKQLKATLDRVEGHQQRLTAIDVDAKDSFTPVKTGLLDLLATVKKRISDRLDEQGPPINE